VSGDIASDFAAARGVPDVDGIVQVQCFHELL
jgi:hypothetical protein